MTNKIVQKERGLGIALNGKMESRKAYFDIAWAGTDLIAILIGITISCLLVPSQNATDVITPHVGMVIYPLVVFEL